MREDIPSPELQDLHPITSDGCVPQGWLRSLDRACTAWLLRRGLIGSPAKERLDLADAPIEEEKEQEEEKEEIATPEEMTETPSQEEECGADSPATLAVIGEEVRP